ncbi:MAG: hypothetical protein CFE24_13755, partial [Flavobacterium sp. BFFFF2]
MKTRKLLTAVIAFLAFAVTTLAQTVPSYVPTNGLVGYWGFNGNANDQSGNGYNGAVNGATLTTDRNGNANSAYLFNATNGGISVASFYPLSTNYTASYWVKYDTQTINTSIFDISLSWLNLGEFVVFREIDNSISFATAGSNGASNNFFVNSATPTNTSSWYNIIVSRNGTQLSIYINGVLVASSLNNNMNTGVNKTMYFGGDPIQVQANNNARFSGKIDDIAIHNRALSQTEITQLYNANPVQTLCTTTVQPYNVNFGDATHDGSTYAWSISPATPSAVITGNGTNSITIDWTNAPDGTYTLQAIETSVDGCVSTAVSASINLSGTPTAPVAPATQTFCTASTVANLTATGTNLQWYAAATGGTALAITTALVSGTTYYVSQTTGTCESTRTAVAVTITTATAPAAVAQTFCASATVANLVATGTAIQWYAAATGGAALATSTALVTSATYYASQTTGTCESTRTAVAVSINDPQITASATTVCAGTAVNLTASTTLSGSPVLPTNLQTGLVGYWPFNGNANDFSVNGLNGTVNGATLTTDRFGNSNSAYNFNGTSNYIQCNLTSTLNTSSLSGITLSGWTNSTSYSQSDPQVITALFDTSNSSYQIGYGNSNGTNGFLSGSCGYSGIGAAMQVAQTTPPSPNNWYHVVMTCDFSTNISRLYINGVFQSQSTSTLISANLNKIVIGKFWNSYWFQNGKLDDIGIWNRALTQSEIQQLNGQATYIWSTGETTATINPTPTATTTYWCDVTANGVTCRKNITITVTPKTTPTFTQVAAVCAGATIAALPSTSTNAVTGSWSPVVNNTVTTTYTFTPTDAVCNNVTTMTITVTPKTTPTFTQVAAVCSGATISAFPTTSTNAVTGTWSPAVNNTVTTTYTFTPIDAVCNNGITMTITVNPLATAPTASASQTFCASPAPTVASLTATGTAIKWYAAATGGTALASTTALVTGTTYYASQTIGTCESTRTSVAVSINDPQITASATTVCSGTAVNLTASTTISGTGTSVLPSSLQSGLVAYYPFNGNANDLSGNGNNGTVNGATLTTDRFGNNSGAYSFDGVSNYIYSSNFPYLTQNFTFCGWIKTTNSSLAMQSFGNHGVNSQCCPETWNFSYSSQNNRLDLFDNTNRTWLIGTNNSDFINSWKFISIVYTNSIEYLYVDGYLVNQRNVATPIATTGSNILRIGARISGDQQFEGSIDDIAIFNRSISHQEITQLYTLGQATYFWSTGETTATINPTPTTTTTYWCDVTTNGVTCRKNVTITVNPKTTPTFTQVAAVCSGATIAALPTTSANAVTGTWSPAVNNTVTTTYTFNPIDAVCNNGITMTITVNPTTAAPTASASQTFCASPAPTVASLTATGTAIQWYASATGGTALASTTALVTGTTYYASQTVGTCESSRTAVAVTINDPQITASAATVCAGTAVNLTASTSLQRTGISVLPSNLQTSLIAYWPFNGSANDLSGNGNNGTVYGATLTTDRFGNLNSAYSFDGLSNYIQAQSINFSFHTISCWVYLESLGTTSSGSDSAIVSTLMGPNYTGYELNIGSGGYIRYKLGQNTSWSNNIGTLLFPSNQWVNVTVTCNGNDSKIFINGVLVLTVFVQNFTTNNYPLIIGARGNYSNGCWFNGKIDDIGIWNRVLTQQEISQLYIQPQTTYAWSTGETSATINPTPSITTTYWCDITTNGVTCRKNVTITVTPKTSPTFTQVAAVCSGATITALPSTSTNAVTGTWSPALDNTATTTYTFTPTAGLCATSATMTITVSPNVTPTFTQVAAVCVGATISALPTTSNNSLTGTWSPALDNTATTTYTFTPTAGLCATTATMTITVNPNVTPTFTQVAAICSGATLSALPTTSSNSLTGTWSPALDNTATTTYTFTPTAGLCATTSTMTITVNPNVTPTFTQVAAICSGATLGALPTASNNNLTGSWSPDLNNAATTTYTFTPTAGLCATTATMTITVKPNIAPSFTQVASVCSGSTMNALPTTSNNGYDGTWSPALNNLSSTNYTFTPTVGLCATTTTMFISVITPSTPSSYLVNIPVGTTLNGIPGYN